MEHGVGYDLWNLQGERRSTAFLSAWEERRRGEAQARAEKGDPGKVMEAFESYFGTIAEQMGLRVKPWMREVAERAVGAIRGGEDLARVRALVDEYFETLRRLQCMLG